MARQTFADRVHTSGLYLLDSTLALGLLCAFQQRART